ncbi:protein-disulfide reductase DsbD family protein [Oceanimonas sp. CHS3-5]|uniref:protein-disulfide reductase DsbD family protein n=1 Tax=Oceanimonas sp. CHS3-5 TaxID=3068186 RepID=UPI00273E80C9|nr:protein-disulfide reductase DsbD domain-containing protein [Oceanimonas sp. CHS3-5]MDP5292652.1 protein-disulfide reductase DsbD family protein [Oceanimonas sp. CHS3-5]
MYRLFSLCLLLLASLTAHAADTGWLQSPDHPPVQVRLVQNGPLNDTSGQYAALLQVKLADDWKTYWRSPGEGGIAPRLEWQDSQNIAGLDWRWPLPDRFHLLGIETQGYQHDVNFPLLITPANAGQPAMLNATLTLPSCTTICVLTEYSLSLPLDPGLALNETTNHAFQQALSRVPRPASRIQATDGRWDASQERVSVILENPAGWNEPVVFIDDTDTSVFSQPDLSVDGDRLDARFLVSSWDPGLNLDGESLTVTVADTNLAEELSVTLARGALPNSSTQPGLWLALGYALLGGLVLNIMPCVLPVLGLKLNSLLLGHRSRAEVRRPLLLSAAGILLSFWGLAAFMLALTWSGAQLGWGIQFQQPGFIGFMLAVTALFSLNLFGLFEIHLPSRLSTWLATGPGGGGSHLMQGMFATLLATPCSAPFLGTAVAAALASSPLILIAIFTGLGLGMALPWLLLAAFPGFVRFMPTPGPWMVKVKWLFGLMLLATSLWLLSLLSSTLGSTLSLLLGTLLVVLPLWSLLRRHGAQALVFGLAGLSLAGAVLGGVALLTQERWVSPAKPELAWQPLDIPRIEREVAAGNRVFVDITADWCITCQANKIGVIQRDPVYSALQQPNVVLMRGDWTRPDPVITDYLRAHGRAGIPFNQVFGPGLPDGRELEVLLTTERVLSALDAAQ